MALVNPYYNEDTGWMSPQEMANYDALMNPGARNPGMSMPGVDMNLINQINGYSNIVNPGGSTNPGGPMPNDSFTFQGAGGGPPNSTAGNDAFNNVFNRGTTPRTSNNPPIIGSPQLATNMGMTGAENVGGVGMYTGSNGPLDTSRFTPYAGVQQNGPPPGSIPTGDPNTWIMPWGATYTTPGAINNQSSADYDAYRQRAFGNIMGPQGAGPQSNPYSELTDALVRQPGSINAQTFQGYLNSLQGQQTGPYPPQQTAPLPPQGGAPVIGSPGMMGPQGYGNGQMQVDPYRTGGLDPGPYGGQGGNNPYGSAAAGPSYNSRINTNAPVYLIPNDDPFSQVLRTSRTPLYPGQQPYNSPNYRGEFQGGGPGASGGAPNYQQMAAQFSSDPATQRAYLMDILGGGNSGGGIGVSLPNVSNMDFRQATFGGGSLFPANTGSGGSGTGGTSTNIPNTTNPINTQYSTPGFGGATNRRSGWGSGMSLFGNQYGIGGSTGFGGTQPSQYRGAGTYGRPASYGQSQRPY